METIEIISAFALSLSFLLLIWTIKGFMLRPYARGGGIKITTVLTADGSTKNLEREVANLRWLKEDGRLRTEILIVDAGMNSQTAEVARSLQRRDPTIRICTPEEIANIITRGIPNGEKG
ncbi:MAG: hypothetical protein VB064_02460 [Oscillospiraceae bacterium]|nr:hypothetical protein [Oscillospiraceae bacterium]